MGTNEHLTKIVSALKEMRQQELKRGTVVRAQTTLGVAPADLDYIRRHAEALAAENAEMMRQLNIESDLAWVMRRELDFERARVARLQRYAWQLEMLLPPTQTSDANVDALRLGLQPGDLPDEEATR